MLSFSERLELVLTRRLSRRTRKLAPKQPAKSAKPAKSLVNKALGLSSALSQEQLRSLLAELILTDSSEDSE